MHMCHWWSLSIHDLSYKFVIIPVLQFIIVFSVKNVFKSFFFSFFELTNVMFLNWVYRISSPFFDWINSCSSYFLWNETNWLFCGVNNSEANKFETNRFETNKLDEKNASTYLRSTLIQQTAFANSLTCFQFKCLTYVRIVIKKNSLNLFLWVWCINGGVLLNGKAFLKIRTAIKMLRRIKCWINNLFFIKKQNVII